MADTKRALTWAECCAVATKVKETRPNLHPDDGVEDEAFIALNYLYPGRSVTREDLRLIDWLVFNADIVQVVKLPDYQQWVDLENRRLVREIDRQAEKRRAEWTPERQTEWENSHE